MKTVLKAGTSLAFLGSCVTLFPAMALAQTSASTEGSNAARAVTEAVPPSDQIIVTARRREESAQSVPVSVTAFSGEALRTAGVKSLSDLTAITPGLRFSSEGEGNTTSVTLRGLAALPVGETLPAVVTYFSEVALPSKGVNVPTFDLENIQVLKGPQGTLFGRNTIGGAVLLTPRRPEYYTNGYVEGTYGNLDYWRLGGAINVPLVEDVLAVRIAGEIKRRDGYIKDVSGGPALSNIHNESIRGSIRFDPTPDISNILTVEYFNAPEQPTGNIPTAVGTGIGTIELFFGADYAQTIRDLVAAQQARGPFAVDYGVDGRSFREGIALVNTTEIDLSDNITLKNIFGYRRLETDIIGNFAGLSPSAFDGLPLGQLGVLVQNVQIARQLLSNEIQLQGQSFEDRFEWLIGGIYSEDRPFGDGNGTWGHIFSPFYPQPRTFVSTIFGSSSKGLFAQGTLDIGDWTVEGLQITGGFRYTWDDITACSLGLSETPGAELLGFNEARYVSDSECRAVANLDNPTDGAGIVDVNDGQASYTLGLDWQATEDVLLYFAHRHGFRPVNVNSPKFETQFTTGGTGCLNATGACPDLRPFQFTRPEKIDDFEIGLKSEWRLSGVRGRLNVALYQNKISNQVQFLQVAVLGIPGNALDNPQSGALGINAATVRNRGFEVDGFVGFTPRFTVSFNGAYNKAKVLSLNVPPNLGGLSLSEGEINRPTPEFSGSAGFDWELPVDVAGGRVALHGDVFHTSSYRPQAGERMQGYTIANARLDIKNIGNSGIDLGLWSRNLFDEAYASIPVILVGGFPVRTEVFGEPRTYGVDLRFSF